MSKEPTADNDVPPRERYLRVLEGMDPSPTLRAAIDKARAGDCVDTTKNDAPAFRSVVVDYCPSANTPHLRYRVIWPDGTPDEWCQGLAPHHIGPRMCEQLRTARIRVTPPGSGAAPEVTP